MSKYVFLFMFVAISCFAQSYFSVNEYDIEARVDSTFGYFALGKHSTGQCITEGFDDPSAASSNPVFMIDGEIYGWDIVSPTHNLNDYIAPGFPRLLISTNTIQNRWIFPLPSGEEVQIDQFFTPVFYHPYDTMGYIKIKYNILNNGMLFHSVGVEHKWDINLDSVDDPPISIPGSMGDTNTVYSGYLPGAFVVAESSLFIADTVQLVVAGFLGIEGATSPDFIAFGEESLLIPSKFTIDASFAGGTHTNTGALLRWNPRTLPPGGSLDLITYYGFGNITSTYGEFAICGFGSDWSVDCCMLIGNPKEFWLDVKNTSAGLTTLDTVWVCIEFDTTMASLHIDLTDAYLDTVCTEFYDLAPGMYVSPAWLIDADEDTCGTFSITYICSVSTPGVSPAETTLYFNIPCVVNIPIPLIAGWNLISSPVYGSVPAFTLGVTEVYRWDNPTSSYIDEAFLEEGLGYWLLSTSVDTVYSMFCLPELAESVFTGWNLIGTVDEAISTSRIYTDPLGMGLGFWGWNSISGYFSPDSLLPGHGYWFLSSGHGVVAIEP